MKRYIFALCLTVAGVLMTSCLSSDNSTTSDYYQDAAISSFSVSVINQYIHTTSKSGGDSIYKSVLTSPCTFSIDQYQSRIYNTDSLPSDCDLKHVLVTISSKNNGVIVIRSLTSDSLTYYSSTDSLDFSQPREIRVYADDRSFYHSYEVSINIHQGVTGKLLWEKRAASEYPADSNKALWESRASEAGMKQFIGAGTVEAYALSNEGQLMVTTDEGATWTADKLDEDPSLLPTSHIAFISTPHKTNNSCDYQLLVGARAEGDKACVVWRKLVDYAPNSEKGEWAYIPLQSNNKYYLPVMDRIELVYYRGNILAIGSNGIIYVSYDQGITWKEQNGYTLPSGLWSTANISATTDEKGDLWVINNDNNDTWRGYMIE